MRLLLLIVAIFVTGCQHECRKSNEVQSHEWGIQEYGMTEDGKHYIRKQKYCSDCGGFIRYYWESE